MKDLILLHGALGASRDLDPLKQTLEELGIIAHTFSFSGHGRTNFNQNFGIEQFASELEMFIKQRELERPAVFGYSMGGFVALKLSSSQPQLISKIITLGTKFNWSAESVEKETKMLDPKSILEKVPAFAKVLENKHGEAWQELLIKTAGLMREINIKSFLQPEVLKQIEIPVQLGLGDKDQMVTLEETQVVFKTLPKASMYMLPQTKHPVETASVKLLATIIVEFLEKQKS